MHIISRKAWGAKPPKCRTRQDPDNVTEVFIHWPGQPGIARHVDAVQVDPDDIGADSHPEWCALPDHLIEAAARISGPAAERAWMRSVQDFHQGPQRKWCDFAYNFAVFKSGRIYRGRGAYTVPAGQEGHNTNTLAIVCVLGTADARVPVPMQESLIELIRWIERKRAHGEVHVRPHRAVNQTTCPGNVLTAFVPRLDRV